MGDNGGHVSAEHGDDTAPHARRVSTGIAGLDEILGGGLPAGHIYLVEGESGVGKTTVGLQFLLEGQRQGERTLWISLSETERELRQIAHSHGWSLDGIEVCNPASASQVTEGDEKYSFFSPADVELEEIRTAILGAIDRVRPARVVFDPFSDIRHLARDVLRYRRQVLALRDVFTARECTAVLMQEMTRGTPGDVQAEALVHGYLTLQQDIPDYGGQRRRLRVHKMRGMPFRDGFHDFSLETGGIHVYPRLVAAEHLHTHGEQAASSGLPELDTLLGGGVDRGSSLLIMGPAGVGKSTVSTQYALTAAARGERVSVFVFDETTRTYITRAEKLGYRLGEHIAAGTLSVRQIDGAEFSPGHFAHVAMHAVRVERATMVIIDSLSGYLGAMPEERFLATHVHELLMSLNHSNVVSIVTLAQHGIMGERLTAPVDISYLADTVLLMRYFEAFGAVRRAISVVKKRRGAHEVFVREMEISDAGLHIGAPLAQFQGVLTGHPEFMGDASQLSPPP